VPSRRAEAMKNAAEAGGQGDAGARLFTLGKTLD